MRDWWKSGLPASASLRTYGAGAVIVLIFGAILADASDDTSLILWCLFSVGGYLSVVILSVLIRHPLEELPVSVRRWATFVVLIASGPITVTIAIGIAAAGGVSVSSPPWDALLLSSVALAFWLVVGARLSCSLSVDDRLRQELLQELAREKALALESQRLVEGDRDRLIEDARQMMSRRLRAFAQEDSSPNAMAGNLRILIDESIRPLSRTLHAAQVREDELVEQVAMMRVPAPRPLWSYLRELHRVDRLDWLLVIGSATVSVVVTALGFTWALPAAIAVIPSVYVSVLDLLLLLVIARAAMTEDELTQALRAADRESSLVRQLAWVTRRRLANTMHGEVQARILASALRVGSFEPDEIDVEMQSLARDLQDLLNSQTGDGDWQVAWERLVEMWQMAIDLDVAWEEGIDPTLAADGVAGSALVAVVGEAITNAVRHGLARSVEVRVERELDLQIRVDVIDDGSVNQPGTPSLGTATLDAVCSHWSLEAKNVGHHFRAWIPLRATRENSEQCRV